MYPLSMLENMLHPSSQPDSITIGDETITLQQLIDFWIEGHKKLSGVTKFLKDAKTIMEKKNGQQEKSNEGSKGQKELQTEQQVERTSELNRLGICGFKGKCHSEETKRKMSEALKGKH